VSNQLTLFYPIDKKMFFFGFCFLFLVGFVLVWGSVFKCLRVAVVALAVLALRTIAAAIVASCAVGLQGCLSPPALYMRKTLSTSARCAELTRWCSG
jgi:hypothetical protein